MRRTGRIAGRLAAALAALAGAFAVGVAGDGVSPGGGAVAVEAGAAPAMRAEDAAPRRVVSMNLCTDQLALLTAGPGQLVSVSRWSARPEASNLAGAAARLPLNGGGAEEVWLMRPDLVLTGSFDDPAAAAMLRRLGVRVEVFEPVAALSEIPERLRRLGRLLGREAAAEAVVRDFEAALARARGRARGLPEIGAAYHYPNGYTSGRGTLAAEIMAAARLENAAGRLGLSGVAPLPLEALVMLRPFLIRTSGLSGARHGRAFETGAHPAMAALAAEGGARVEARRQVCGTPFVTMAVDALVDARAPALAAAE